MSSSLCLLDAVLLRTLGFGERTRWQINGRPGDTFEQFGLVAEPGVLALSRTRGVCVIHCLPGCARGLAADEVAKARLDAAVCASVAPFGSDIQITSRIVFEEVGEDGLEIRHSPEELAAAVSAARRWIAGQGLTTVRTCEVARALSTRLS